MRTLLLALTLSAPLTHAEMSITENMQKLAEARKTTLVIAQRQDDTLIKLICEKRTEHNCSAQARVLLEQYKSNVIRVHKLEERYDELTGL